LFKRLTLYIYVEWFLGKREPTEEEKEWFKNVVTKGGLVLGRKILNVDRHGIRIRIARPYEVKDNNPREIIFKELAEGKDVAYSSKKHDYNLNGSGIIAWKKVTCSSRTGMHWTDYILLIRYKDRECKIDIKEHYSTCRGNIYNTEKELKCVEE